MLCLYFLISDLRKYRGRVSFLPLEEYRPPAEKHVPRSQSETHNAESPHDNGLLRPQSAVETTGMLTSPNPDSETSSSAEDEFQQSLENLKVMLNEQDETSEVNGNESESINLSHVMKTEPVDDVIHSSVPTPLLAPLDQPVPADWVTLEGEFVNVAAIYLTHLAKDMIAMPESRLNDGTIYLSVTKAPISRMKLIQMFNAMQDGKYNASAESQIIKVKAFRFEPEEKDGIMTCDGERIAYGPVQGQVLPSMANVMSLSKTTASQL